jgi:hypothetical protein
MSPNAPLGRPEGKAECHTRVEPIRLFMAVQSRADENLRSQVQKISRSVTQSRNCALLFAIDHDGRISRLQTIWIKLRTTPRMGLREMDIVARSPRTQCAARDSAAGTAVQFARMIRRERNSCGQAPLSKGNQVLCHLRFVSIWKCSSHLSGLGWSLRIPLALSSPPF